MIALQKKDVKYVVTYNDRAFIKKIVFQNGIVLDVFPEVQEILYMQRQTSSRLTEAGGMLLGYENACTGNFTISGATEPQVEDIRSRVSLLLGKQHQELLKSLKSPYGYIGTWHTHPSKIPIPSFVDIQDWKKSIIKNSNSTSALIFIIAGTEAFRVWLCDSTRGILIEGKEL
ncbi:uBA/THIF-type NAD/FAD binding protein [Clostridium sp. CAG:242]|nr:uBA/THIF-type NAD/FAD binding protein [Clostridium sp. CAG:242]